MFRTVAAMRFVKVMGTGRTKPCLIECEDDDGNKFELVVKYSSMMMEGVKNLTREAIVAMLAADLDLPVAEPFLVELSPEFVSTVTDPAIRGALAESCPLAFGSALQTGFSVWPKDQNVTSALTQTAAEIIVFDQIITNVDRRPVNPNCLVAGAQLLMIDHELSFQRVLFWKEPWVDGGLTGMNTREHHIFAGPYYETLPTELERFASAWEGLTPEQFDSYRNTLPDSWVYDDAHVNEILSYLRDVKVNIRLITTNALRELK
jgi:hypothetical protein